MADETAEGPITLTTEEPQRNRTNRWELYWFHATDLDANCRADRNTLLQAGYVPLSRAQAAEQQVYQLKSDLDTAVSKALEAQGRVERLEAERDEARAEAGRMHYLGNMLGQKSQAEWDELSALMRKYPARKAPLDPRPLCIVCKRPWVPAEGVDATRERCGRCTALGEGPATGAGGSEPEGADPRQKRLNCKRCFGLGYDTSGARCSHEPIEPSPPPAVLPGGDGPVDRAANARLNEVIGDLERILYHATKALALANWKAPR